MPQSPPEDKFTGDSAQADQAAQIHKLSERCHHLESQNRQLKAQLEALSAEDSGQVPSSNINNRAERQQIEQRLQEREEQLRVIADSIPGLIAQVDQTGRYVFVNSGYEAWYGHPREQIVGRTVQELVGDETYQQLLPYVEAALSGQTVTFESNIIYPEGRKTVLITYTPHLGPDNQPRGFYVMVTDITALKQVEEALRESEARFRKMADSTPALIWMAGPDKQFTYFNKSWLDFTGRTLEQEQGFGWTAGVHADDYQRCLEIYNTAFDARRPFETEYRLRQADGEYRWIVTKAVPLFEGNYFGGYIGTCIDIDERKKAELIAHLLAEAGQVLASSLDYAERLTKLAQLAVPHLADWCAIDLFDKAWTIHHVAVAHKDPAKVELAHELHRRYPPRPEDLAGGNRPWLQGQSELYPEISEGLLEAAAQDAEHYQILRQLTLRSALVIPLVAREQVLGRITFVWAESGNRYNEDDLILAEELARRAAIALDNSRAYWAEQEARWAAEEAATRITALQAVTAALAKALTPADVVEVIVNHSVAVLEASGGAVMLLTEDGAELEMMQATGYSEAGLKAFRRFPLAASIPASDAVRSGEPVWLASHEDFAARYPHLISTRPADSRTEGVAVVPLLLEGRALGAMAISFTERGEFSPEDKIFLLTLAGQCAQALERARLYEAEQRARAEAEAAQRSLALVAEMRERHRLAQELHDNVAQALGYLNLKIDGLQQQFADNQVERVQADLRELKQLVSETYTDIRGEIFNLRTAPTTQLNFLETLRQYVEKYKRFYGLEIQLIFETDKALFQFSSGVAVALIRTIQEALINVRKHAQVNRAIIRLAGTPEQVQISIEDEGEGFDLTTEHETSFGLRIMHERIEGIGGQVAVHSERGQGTRITLLYPLATNNQEAKS